MDQPNAPPPNQARLIGDLRQVIENAEELLKNTDQHPSAEYNEARARLAEALSMATNELTRIEDVQIQRMIEATQALNEKFADLGGEARLMRAFDE